MQPPLAPASPSAGRRAPAGCCTPRYRDLPPRPTSRFFLSRCVCAVLQRLSLNWGGCCWFRRGRARSWMPTERHRPKWRPAMEMIGGLIASGHRPPVVAPDAATATPPPSGSAWTNAGSATSCRQALHQRLSRRRGAGHPAPPRPAPPRRPGTPPQPGHPGPTHQLQGPGARRRASGPTAGHLATRDQERPEQPDRNVGSEFTALRIRPANRDIPR